MPEAPAPIQFQYLNKLYEAMRDASEAVDGEAIYEGKVVETFNTLGISMSYYTPLFNSLKELGCIELLDRGVRSRPTRYRLHKPPERAAYDARYKSGLTGGAKPATIPLSELEQRLKNLERRLKGLDIKEIVVDFESRLKALEAEGGSK